MKLAIIGATGFVGSRVLEQALQRGHEVTAIGRRKGVLGERPGLTEVSVDLQDPDRLGPASDPDRLTRIVAGHDAVISCFNPGHDLIANPNLYRDVVEGTRVIIDGVRRAGVQRLLYLGGAASLRTPNGKDLVDDFEFFDSLVNNRPEGAFMPDGPAMLDIPRAARIALYLFEREQVLDWIFVSPSLYLGNYGGSRGPLRYGFDELLLDENGRSARLDVDDLALAIIDQTEDPKGARIHLTVASTWPTD